MKSENTFQVQFFLHRKIFVFNFFIDQHQVTWIRWLERAQEMPR